MDVSAGPLLELISYRLLPFQCNEIWRFGTLKTTIQYRLHFVLGQFRRPGLHGVRFGIAAHGPGTARW